MFRRRHVLLLVGALLLALVAIGPGAAIARKHRRHRKSNVLPAMGHIPGPSIFGIDTETQDSNHSYYVRDIPAARSLGARYTHVTLGPATGHGGLAAADYEVTAARKHGMGVVLSLGGVSQACSIPVKNPHACPPTTASDLAIYEGYVRKMLLRYRNVVQYYESWTEPNNSSSWAGGPDPARYATLLKADYATVQAVNRQYHKQLKLLFGSPIGFQVNNNPKWTGVFPYTDEVLAALHGARPFDGAALHAYRLPESSTVEAPGPNAEVCDYVGSAPVTEGYATPGVCTGDYRWLTWSQEITGYEQIFASHGYGQVPLWLTEFGWNGAPQASGDISSESSQNEYLGQAYNDLLGLKFVQAAMWFNIRDYQPTLVTGDPDYFYHYGLLDYTFHQKPAAATFKSLAKANKGR